MNAKDIKGQIITMANKVHEMLGLIEKGFMENRQEPLTEAMHREHEVNDMERNLTAHISELYKPAKAAKDKKELVAFQQAVETLERMGDEAGSLIERIEIKVAEHLLFSEEGVNEFNETYHTMKESVAMMLVFLGRHEKATREQIIHNGFHVKELVEQYRKAHSERLIQGLCTPMGANMYYDMLDFTGNIARHASNIVKLF